jgi:hypothetical protein
MTCCPCHAVLLRIADRLTADNTALRDELLALRKATPYAGYSDVPFGAPAEPPWQPDNPDAEDLPAAADEPAPSPLPSVLQRVWGRPA